MIYRAPFLKQFGTLSNFVDVFVRGRVISACDGYMTSPLSARCVHVSLSKHLLIYAPRNCVRLFENRLWVSFFKELQCCVVPCYCRTRLACLLCARSLSKLPRRKRGINIATAVLLEVKGILVTRAQDEMAVQQKNECSEFRLILLLFGEVTWNLSWSHEFPKKWH